jgi:rRNA maturation RNase YbeY
MRKGVSYKVLIKKDPRFSFTTRKIRQLTVEILKEYGFGEGTEISLVFVGKRKACQLNQQYRKMDYIPLVLSFPNNQEETPEGNVFLGDVVICFSEAVEKAIVENQRLEAVLDELLRHGIANLVK